jgi:signal transduction histidine kinase
VVDVRGSAIGTVLRPWRHLSTWWSLVHVLLDLPLGLVYSVPVIVLLGLAVGLLPIFPLSMLVVWLMFGLARRLGRVERSRYAALLGVELGDPHAPLPPGSWWSRWTQLVRSASRRREVGYLAAAVVVGAVGFSLAVAAWAGSIVLVALPAYVGSLPGGRATFGLFDIRSGWGEFAAVAIGAAGLVLIAPWLTVALAGVGIRLGRRLLGPGRREQLQQRVVRLEASRVAAVDSAEAERRRIERDLHDGAQQRLVSMAMDLGQAKDRFDADPDEARRLVSSAHDDAKAALAELRQLVRGFHPAVLEDRGLDAALSAVVARSPVPVTLNVDVPVRPSAPVESTAYFVVSEGLANVAKHADATRASVSIVRRHDRLVVEITDDGSGGADPTKGTGLAGLAQRLESHGGWMQILSPPGGPTTLLAELPCES